MSPPPPVLAAYAPALDGLRWTSVGGGFSGAAVWRGDDPDGIPVFALKAWPPGTEADRLARVHDWVGRAAHLPFVVPALRRGSGRDGRGPGSITEHAGLLWDVTRWLPGVPLTDPTTAEVEAACAAVARLHAAWPAEAHAPCPGVRRRLSTLHEFDKPAARARADGNPLLARRACGDELGDLVPRAVAAVAAAGPPAAAALRPWDGVALPLRPCVRDLRADHVLFTGPAVTGVVDFGAMALDHPAVDLARLLGDYGLDDDRFAAGLRAYRAAGGDLDPPDVFVRALDRAGTVCSVIGWLVRLAAGHAPADPVAAADRLRRLTARVEGVTGG